ncbi:nucleoside hydrolase-like domain-containing protein [Larkinella soli]|uniref:nucleoside hydrolase-like domain-containing protein n=1 Tax=Larkinella soli TaxID=1770527 RepID=UPI000FFC5C73|nr:nucleoside hydrolase-like domain-containing protein [Larkinella soli]
MKIGLLWIFWGLFSFTGFAPPASEKKPRILISTDLGGTDPDDNQSMIHFLMYADRFRAEGLVSSPSYGNGSREKILEMIDLYKKDLPRLSRQRKDYPSPEALKAVCKQGRHGPAPLKGYTAPTEGSEWIVRCARKESRQPLWVLVWGGLDDLAQALHDAPDIRSRIRVYWIGGPNKKWSVNSYAYIVENFPDLWLIEANGSYQGFFADAGAPDSLSNRNYYDRYIRDAGFMGRDFGKYYQGSIKMGDTPSLLYVMHGNPNDPARESWGGSFEPFRHSPRRVYHRTTTTADTVPVYSVVEFHFNGPEVDLPPDSACFTMAVQSRAGEQTWPGYSLGKGRYVIRYAPKQTEVLTYRIRSEIPGFPEQSGQLVVNNVWPGRPGPDDYRLGPHWYTDRADPALFLGIQQGARTVQKWRSAVLLDWATRWARLRE